MKVVHSMLMSRSGIKSFGVKLKYLLKFTFGGKVVQGGKEIFVARQQSIQILSVKFS